MSTTATSRPTSAHRAKTRALQLWNAGAAYTQAQDWAGAATAFEGATRTAPTEAPYWIGLALARRELKQWQGALQAAERALRLKPEEPSALGVVGVSQLQLHRYAEAHTAFERLERAGHREAELLFGHALALQRLCRPAAASTLALQALGLRPEMAQAQALLAETFRDRGLKREAAECYRTLLALQPENIAARLHLLYAKREVMDWTDIDVETQDIADALEGLTDGQAGSCSPGALVTMPLSARLHLKGARCESRFLAMGRQRLALTIAVPRDAAARPIRLGLVSFDFREHAVSQLLVEVLEAFDRERFELMLYSLGHDDDSELRARMKRTADHFIDLAAMSDAEATQRIRDDEVELLIDLAGHTRGTRVGMFACRPAPVQAAYLGFPGSTGMAEIDYIVGDPLVTPLALAPNYSEKIAQLPLTLQPNGRCRPLPQPMTRAEAGLPDGAFVMCAFNNTYKIGPEAFDVWCSLLRELPQAVLWLKETTQQLRDNVLRLAAERGVAPERIVFAPTVAYEQHFSRLALADLFVDTWPYGAHTTAADALWSGLPVVTHYGESYASRVAASVLNAAGIGELAFETVADYRCAILALALDPALLATYREHLVRNRLALPLFDTARYAGELMDLFTRMVERWRAGLPAEHLPAVHASEAVARHGAC